jgi:hypothetical protein
MANPTIGATTPRIQYTATASQTVFTVPFEFLANADLAVYVNGTLKTLTTDYTLTGANTTGGGSLTFVTGRTAGEIVTILGNLAYSRDTNKYTKYGLLPAEVLEADFDALQVQSKQLALADQFALRLPMTDSGSAPAVLPAKASRVNTLLGFDANGAPTVILSAANDVSTAISAAQAAQAAAEAANVAAQLAKTNAETAETNAETAETNAETAEAAAELARDASWVNNRIFASTAAGISGTTNGQYFSVPSGSASEYLILYLNSSGTAVEQKRYPSILYFQDLIATPVSGVEYALQDSNDNASEYIESTTGKHYALALDANSINGIPRYQLNRVTRSSANLKASIVHHISYGQSLGLGNGSDIHTLTGADSDGFFDCVMFNANGTTSAGPRAQEGSGTVAQNHASLIAYLEQPITGSSPTGNFETPLGNSLRTVKRLLRDEDGIVYTDFDYILLGSAPAQSNTAIAGLSKGQTPYTNLTNDVTYGLALAQAAGKSYCVDVVYFSQGEADITAATSRATYLSALQQLYTDLNTDIKAITSQSHNIKLVLYQVSVYNQSNPNIALAQLDAAKANSNIILATSVYALEHLSSTNVHLTAAGYAHLGGYYGLAAKRVVVDGASWANLYPTLLTRQGTILEIEFPDTGYSIAASNTLFASQTNYGLTAVRSDGTTANTITSVTVVGPRRVRVVLTDAVAGYLRYGFASWGGNLHDTCNIDPGTFREYTLYRPVLTFDEAFT